MNKAQMAARMKVLERKLEEVAAESVQRLNMVLTTIDSASTDTRMGSGVVVDIKAIGGGYIALPFTVRDGLSKETIESLKADIKRSIKLGNIA
jgi:hypothetical protein